MWSIVCPRFNGNTFFRLNGEKFKNKLRQFLAATKKLESTAKFSVQQFSRFTIKMHWKQIVTSWGLGNCDIDFFNYWHLQAKHFIILNQPEWGQNFAINFQKHQEREQK